MEGQILKYSFYHGILGGENIFKFTFTPVYWGEKINLNLCSLQFIGDREIYSNLFSLPFIEERTYF